MIHWRPAEGEAVAPPAASMELLRKAIAQYPDRPLLRLKLADLHLDKFDFTAAAAALEAAVSLDPGAAGIRPRLARCYNVLKHHRKALETLSHERSPQHERGVALAALGRTDEAEAEFRAVLDVDPHHRHACAELAGLVREAGRVEELVGLCENLNARGASHAQLLLEWGRALALAGDEDKARRLLFDPDRVAERALPVPEGFLDIAEFNTALAEEILTNPHALSDFPPEEEANRGSCRVHTLFSGQRPELARLLLDAIQFLVDTLPVQPVDEFDPWAKARPEAAHLKAWGLIQRADDYETWHLHRGGWLSGVYYVRVPGSVSAEGDGGGCIEFGPPPALARLMPGFIPTWRHAPREGTLLLAPSHYVHRTIPSGLDEYRISFAFDVVPEAA